MSKLWGPERASHPRSSASIADRSPRSAVRNQLVSRPRSMRAHSTLAAGSDDRPRIPQAAICLYGADTRRCHAATHTGMGMSAASSESIATAVANATAAAFARALSAIQVQSSRYSCLSVNVESLTFREELAAQLCTSAPAEPCPAFLLRSQRRLTAKTTNAGCNPVGAVQTNTSAGLCSDALLR
jgi:hypothetical protein